VSLPLEQDLQRRGQVDIVVDHQDRGHVRCPPGEPSSHFEGVETSIAPVGGGSVQ
jgi:hypothetical protein